jgi:hypothetical protein
MEIKLSSSLILICQAPGRCWTKTVQFLRNILSFLCLALLLSHCSQPKKLTSHPKIAFDLNALDKNGLSGPKNGKVAIDYEFCIPAEKSYLDQILKIDPSIKIQKKARGRIRCSRAEWLCMGNTHQKKYREKILEIAELNFVKRIEHTFFE